MRFDIASPLKSDLDPLKGRQVQILTLAACPCEGIHSQAKQVTQEHREEEPVLLIHCYSFIANSPARKASLYR